MDPDNLALDRGAAATPPELEPEPSFLESRWPALVAAVVVALLAGGLWYWWTRDANDPSGDAPRQAVSEVPSEPPLPALGQGEPAAQLPPLDELDPFVRNMLAGLSARPELAALLTTDNLVRRFVVSVENLARGSTPSGQIPVLSPRTSFSVESPESASRISPEAFRRYDGTAATVADLDADGLAQLYGRLKPRLEDAYAELGTGGSFDEAMEQAIRHLLAAPPDAATGEVRPVKGVAYAYSSPDVENLSAAQKQLIRMGPQNARRVQAKLRELALALGIPASRLPTPPST